MVHGFFKGMAKGAAFIGVLVLLEGCQSTQDTELGREFQPSLHYQRYPVVVSSYGRGRYVKARVPKCGKYERDATDTKRNLPYSNFGCASQQNMAAMVSDPRDFVRPRPMTPKDATRRVKVISAYREPALTATPVDETTKVTISDAIK